MAFHAFGLFASFYGNSHDTQKPLDPIIALQTTDL